jgi:uncharacterized membrane protein (GlpM family)
VCLASWIAKRVSPTLAGMLLAFPFLIGTTLLFSLGAPERNFRLIVTGVLWGLIPLAGFCASILIGSRFFPVWASVGVGLATWVVLALTIYVWVVR